MRILFVYSSPINSMRGGIQKVTYTLATQFREMDHSVMFLSFNMEKTAQSGFPQLFVPDTSNTESDVNITYIRNLVYREKIDVVINQSGMSHPIHKLLATAKGTNHFILISCIHNSIFGGVENYERTHRGTLKNAHLNFVAPLVGNKWMKKLLCKLYVAQNRRHYQYLCEASYRVVVLSNAMYREMKCITGRDYSNIIQIPNGMMIPDENPLLEEKEKMFLYVGKLNSGYKRADLLLPVWKAFSSRHPDYMLYLLGDGPAKASLEKRILEDGIPNIIFEGWQSPEKYYQRAQGLLLTSCSESFGMVIVEAMSYGVIPFAYDAYEQIHEIIDDGQNGFLAPDEDSDKLASIMDCVVNSATLAGRIAQNAIHKSRQFDAKIIAKKWLELIQ